MFIGTALASAVVSCTITEGGRESAPVKNEPDRLPSSGSSPVAARQIASPCGTLPTEGDTTARAIAATVVNTGTAGMAAQVRWVRSPDGCTLFIVEDPAAVEAEPVVDAVVIASEREGRLTRIDGVWDALPSPDWTRVAYGEGRVVSGREQDSLPPAEWVRLAKWAGVPQAAARAASFSASGMNYAVGIARLGMLEVATGDRRALPVPLGWRVRWSADGRTIGAGHPGESNQDDKPAVRWQLVDAETGAARGAIVPDANAPDWAPIPAWTEGPLIDISAGPDTVTRRVALRGRYAEAIGRAGRVLVVPQCDAAPRTAATVGAPAAACAAPHDVGPGSPLAATAGGRYVLALAPRDGRREYDPYVRLVVYTLY